MRFRWTSITGAWTSIAGARPRWPGPLPPGPRLRWPGPFGAGVFGLRVPDPALLFLAVMSWALALLGLGTALGATLRSQSELNVAYDIGGVLFSALGGALIPAAELPGWARAIAPASPGYWAMAALRSALRGQAGPTARDAAVLVVVAAIAGAVAAWRMSRSLPRSRLL